MMLQKQVALITGAAGFGIGTVTAEFLAREGATVILNGLEVAPLEKAVNQVRQAGELVDYVQGDVSNPQDVERMVKNIIDKYERIDILVNNAAHGAPNQRIDYISDKIWDSDIREILSGSFYCTRAAVPSMIKQRHGKVVFISSSAAIRGTWGRGVPYAAAKAGLIGMTKRLALELAEFSINVNAIAPSQVNTPRVKRGGRRTEESLEEYGKKYVPLGRVGKPEDIANLVVFLVSKKSSFITGQIIEIDGGLSLSSKATLPNY